MQAMLRREEIIVPLPLSMLKLKGIIIGIKYGIIYKAPILLTDLKKSINK